MSLIAEFRIEIPPLAQASTAVPEMRFTGEDIVLDDEQSHKFVFTAHGSQFDAFESALEDDPTVAEYTAFTKSSGVGHYVVTYAADVNTRGTYHVAVEEGIAYTRIRLQDGEYTIQARTPDRDALASLRAYCRENGIPFRLERLYYEESGDAGDRVLTDAQRAALRRAYERGYFDSPRRTTLTEVGDDLGISRQAVADRLRRGYKRLIEATVV